jgi:hypothetical protein
MRDLSRIDQGKFAAFDIQEAREQIRADLQRRLDDARSFLNSEKVMALVFEGDESTALTFLRAMLTALDCELTEAEPELLYVIADAWDYFPHRSLQGHCPEETRTCLFADALRS